MNRDIFHVLKILVAQGFSNECLEKIIQIFSEKNVPLAQNLSFYIRLDKQACHTSGSFKRRSVSKIWHMTDETDTMIVSVDSLS